MRPHTPQESPFVRAANESTCADDRNAVASTKKASSNNFVCSLMVDPLGAGWRILYLYRNHSTIHPPITRTFTTKLTARIVLTPQVRKKGGRRRTAHT